MCTKTSWKCEYLVCIYRIFLRTRHSFHQLPLQMEEYFTLLSLLRFMPHECYSWITLFFLTMWSGNRFLGPLIPSWVPDYPLHLIWNLHTGSEDQCHWYLKSVCISPAHICCTISYGTAESTGAGYKKQQLSSGQLGILNFKRAVRT